MKAVTLVIVSFLATTMQLWADSSETLPKKLAAYSGGGWTGWHYVELAGNTLLCWTGDEKNKESAERITPSIEQWREFRRQLDEIGIWRWKQEYATHAILDATNWTFEVKYADASIKTGGDSGVYPGKDSGAQDSPDYYLRYIKALHALLGRDSFPQ